MELNLQFWIILLSTVVVFVSITTGNNIRLKKNKNSILRIRINELRRSIGTADQYEIKNFTKYTIDMGFGAHRVITSYNDKPILLLK